MNTLKHSQLAALDNLIELLRQSGDIPYDLLTTLNEIRVYILNENSVTKGREAEKEPQPTA